MMHKAWCSIEEVPYCFPRPSIKFQGHKGQKIDDLDQIWARLLGRSQLSNPSDLPCSRSSVKFQRHMALKIVELTQIGRFWTVTPVWIHKWLRNDAQSCKNRRRGDLLFFKVIRQISRSRGSENRPIWPRLGAFPDCNSSLNSPMATKWCTKLEVALKSCPIVFQSHPSNFKVTRF